MSNNHLKILVTGAAGFIGFHLTKKLLDLGHTVLGVDSLNDYYDVNLKQARLNQLITNENFEFQKIDIADSKSLNKVFTDFQPNKVVNLAAQAGVRYSLENPQAYIDANVTGFMNILECCRHHKVEGLIYASSSSVYGGNTKIPFSVDDRVDHPISIYAASKKANELMAHTYSHLFGLNTTGLRFFTVYGPWGRPDMAMYIFANKIQKGEPIPVFNNGQMKRDFTFIDDIISGTMAAIDKNEPCEVFNLGNSHWENLMDMIGLIEQELGKKADIQFMGMQPGDVEKTFADIKHSTKKLGYKPTTSINEGIPQFINWFKSYNS
jgi:UDP-glucuronate 4-epimerase